MAPPLTFVYRLPFSTTFNVYLLTSPPTRTLGRPSLSLQPFDQSKSSLREAYLSRRFFKPVPCYLPRQFSNLHPIASLSFKLRLHSTFSPPQCSHIAFSFVSVFLHSFFWGSPPLLCPKALMDAVLFLLAGQSPVRPDFPTFESASLTFFLAALLPLNFFHA